MYYASLCGDALNAQFPPAAEDLEPAQPGAEFNRRLSPAMKLFGNTQPLRRS